MLFKALNLITDKKIQNFQKNSKKHLHFVKTSDIIPYVVTILGFRQMVRHWILIPAFWGFESLKPSLPSHICEGFFYADSEPKSVLV